jgi:hypothetical protein
MTLFKTAQRTQAKLRLAIDGPSGSGKTYSALLIAKGLAGGDLSKVALIDTERGSGSLYADLGPYATLVFEPPYSPQRYMKAIAAAEEEGFTVIVIDSLTHAWSGEGGLLDYVDSVAKASSSGNSFAAWKQGTPLQARLVDSITGSGCHVIVTMRSKTEWVIEENDRGKKAPRKVGLAPDQRKDFEYEMTLVMDLSREHIATTSKDRTGLFDERLEVPSEKMGVELAAWLGSAAPEPPKPARSVQQDAQREQAATAEKAPTPAPTPASAAGNGLITAAQAERLRAAIHAKGRDRDSFLGAAAKKAGIGDGTLEGVPTEHYEHMLEVLAELPDPPLEPGPHPWEAASEPPAPAAATEPPETPIAATEAAAPQDEADEMPPGMDYEEYKASRAPEIGKRKKGTVTPEQLTMLAAICAKLERLGVPEAEWRVFLADEFKVASRTELMKSTTAPRAREALQRWVIDLESGIAVAGSGRQAVA